MLLRSGNVIFEKAFEQSEVDLAANSSFVGRKKIKGK
jgi:hypothetical protein